MNEKRVKALRDRIAEAPAEYCDMDRWKCGSVACIGGWAEIQRAEELGIDAGWGFVSVLAEYLGLSEDSFTDLCFVYPARPPVGGWKDWMLKRLDLLIEIGDVQKGDTWLDLMGRGR